MIAGRWPQARSVASSASATRRAWSGWSPYCYKPKAYLGSRRGIKGHEDFIDAVGLLRRDGLDVIGVVAGGAWQGAEAYYDAVQAYARANTDARVMFLGTRRDIAAIYADLDVAVHPSLSENLGGAAESLLFGVPTVTTNVGGFPDLIADGVTGRMVPPRDPVEPRRRHAGPARRPQSRLSDGARRTAPCAAAARRQAHGRSGCGRFTRRLSRPAAA